MMIPWKKGTAVWEVQRENTENKYKVAAAERNYVTKVTRRKGRISHRGILFYIIRIFLTQI